jgi:hypothetical protein
MSKKNSNDTIGNRTRELSACSAVPQTTDAHEKTPLNNQKRGKRRKIFKIKEEVRIQSGNQTSNYSFENSDHDTQITSFLTGNTS